MINKNEVKIIDFGIGKKFENSTDFTCSGTPLYMSP